MARGRERAKTLFLLNATIRYGQMFVRRLSDCGRNNTAAARSVGWDCGTAAAEWSISFLEVGGKGQNIKDGRGSATGSSRLFCSNPLGTPSLRYYIQQTPLVRSTGARSNLQAQEGQFN